MRVKRLVTSTMGNKKATNRGEKRKKEDKEAKITESARIVWKKSKCTESDLLHLVDESLLRDKDTVEWRPAGTDSRVNLCFFSILSNGDWPSLLVISSGMSSTTMASLIQTAIFVHFSEAFLGIEPHFQLFRYHF